MRPADEGPGPAALLGLLLQRFAWRHARRAPGQTLLLVGIIAVGVAVVVSIRLANRAAVSSFRGFTDTVAGTCDWIVRPPAGTLPESVLPELRAALAGAPVVVVPVVESTATWAGTPAAPLARGPDAAWGEAPTLQILGLDLVSLHNLAVALGADRTLLQSTDEAVAGAGSDGGAADFWRTLDADDLAFASAGFAARRGLAPGQPFNLLVLDRIVPLRLGGVLPALPGQPPPPDDLVVLDIRAAQALAGEPGRLHRIELTVERGPDIDRRRAALREKLEALGAGGRWDVESPAASRATAETMTRAFRLNLTILSLLALLVGLFLVVEALDGAVVRRRQEIAILRSLGVPPGTIRRAWLAESLAFGLAGSIAGLLLGWAGAQVAVQAVGRSVNALYYAASVEAASLHPGEAILALLLGTGASLVAGWWPARSACRTPPAQLLPRGRLAGAPPARQDLIRGGLALVAAVALGFTPPVVLADGTRFPLLGYLGALAAVFAAALLAPALLTLTARAAEPLARRSAVVRYALSGLRRLSGRHRLAVAGLVTAVGMTASMAILVGSFETTIRGWIGTTLQADLFVASEGAQAASSRNRIRPETWRALLADPAVRDGAPLFAERVRLGGRETFLTGADFAFFARQGVLTWRERPETWPPLDAAGPAVPAVVSEAFARRFAAEVGTTVTLPTPQGPRPVVVAGVFTDYGNERGTVMVPAAAFTGWFGSELAGTVTLLLQPGEDAEAVRDRLAAAHPGLRVHSQRSLREQVYTVFHQTFSITYALELIGLLVALAGLALSLASVLLARREDLTTLRALGWSRREIARAAAVEGSALAAAGSLGGLLLSLGLGVLLVFVINRQSFGWTLQFDLPVGPLAALGAAIVALGAVVSLAVGRWGSDLRADREE